MSLYKLNGKTPVPVEDPSEWAFDMQGSRSVGDDSKDEVRVSTVFLGIDHQFGEGPPLLFETMIFGGEHGGEQWRYSTWEEAEEGHRSACKLAGVC